MNEAELLQVLARGEDSRHQFKRDATNADSMAAELAAFANSGSGRLFLGVADDGSIIGLDTTRRPSTPISTGVMARAASSPASRWNRCCRTWAWAMDAS